MKVGERRRVTRVEDLRLISLQHVGSNSGTLTAVEAPLIPFEPRRVYWIQDLDPNAVRGFHAHRELEQVMIALSGAITFYFRDAAGGCREVQLDDRSSALYVPRMLWREFRPTVEHSTLLVLASAPYSEDDYIRDWDKFSNTNPPTQGTPWR